MITDYLDFTHQNMLPKKRLELDIGNIYENKIECKKCGWIIRSKNRHHYATCNCKSVSVDGGSWYQSITGDKKDVINHISYFNYKHK